MPAQLVPGLRRGGGIQTLPPQLSASFLDSRFRGNDAALFLSGKTYPRKPPPSGGSSARESLQTLLVPSLYWGAASRQWHSVPLFLLLK